jgi:hypothetical protein
LRLGVIVKLEGLRITPHSYSPLFGRPGFKIQRKGCKGNPEFTAS